MAGRQANRHEEIRAFARGGADAAVGDRVGFGGDLDVSLILHITVIIDVALCVVAVHVVGSHADAVLYNFATEAVLFAHHVCTDHSASFANVQLCRPAAGLGELVGSEAIFLEDLANVGGDSRVIGQGPHQPFLISLVLVPHLGPLRVGRLGVAVIHADEVGAEGKVVVHIGFAIGHGDGSPRHASIARVEIAKQQFKVPFVVIRRLGPGQSILRNVGRAHAEVVGLNAMVSVTVNSLGLGRDEGDESAVWIASLDKSIDLFGELVVDRFGPLQAIDRLAVGCIGFAANVILDSRGRHQVPFVARVDEHRSRECATAFHPNFDDAIFLLGDPVRAVESFSRDEDHLRLCQPIPKDFAGDMGLEGPHGVFVFLVECFTAKVFLSGFAGPPVGVAVHAMNSLIEFASHTADRSLVADVGRPETSGRQSSEMLRRFDQCDGVPQLGRCDRSNDPAAGTAVDDQIDLRILCVERPRGQKTPQGYEGQGQPIYSISQHTITCYSSAQIECGSKLIDAIMLITTQALKANTAGPT